MECFEALDVLRLGHFVFGTFWDLGRFEAWDVLWLWTFCILDVSGFGRFEAWTFEAGTFCSLDVMYLNVLYFGRFAAWTFCMCTGKAIIY